MHRGPLTHLSETINDASDTWLPRSEFEHVEGAKLERYDDRFGNGGKKSELDFLVPVKRKAS